MPVPSPVASGGRESSCATAPPVPVWDGKHGRRYLNSAEMSFGARGALMAARVQNPSFSLGPKVPLG